MIKAEDRGRTRTKNAGTYVSQSSAVTTSLPGAGLIKSSFVLQDLLEPKKADLLRQDVVTVAERERDEAQRERHEMKKNGGDELAEPRCCRHEPWMFSNSLFIPETRRHTP